MTAAGTTILNSEYNAVQSAANTLGGKTAYGTTGWGQTLSSSQVTANSQITVTQWNNLRKDLVNFYAHQNNGSVPAVASTPPAAGASFSISGTAAGGPITFTGSISGTTLTISSVPTGTVKVGLAITGSGVIAGTYIAANISGSGNGSTWTVSTGVSSVTQTVASTTITAQAVTMTVSAVTAGWIEPGQRLNGGSIPANTFVISWANTDGALTGTGNTGTYYINQVTTQTSSSLTSTKIISYSDFSSYSTLQSTITTAGNALPVGSNASVSSTNTSFGINQKTTAWNGSIVHQATITFTSGTGYSAAQAAAWYFNSGSTITFGATYSNVTAPKDQAWSNFLSEIGTISLGANTTTVSGGSGSTPTVASSTGFWQLVTTDTQLYNKVFSTTLTPELTYPSNYYTLTAKIDSTSARTAITVTITFADANAPGNPAGHIIDESVNSSSTYPLSSNIGTFYASGSYVSVTGYLPTYSLVAGL